MIFVIFAKFCEILQKSGKSRFLAKSGFWQNPDLEIWILPKIRIFQISRSGWSGGSARILGVSPDLDLGPDLGPDPKVGVTPTFGVRPKFGHLDPNLGFVFWPLEDFLCGQTSGPIPGV